MESISEIDVGQYICRGENRAGFTEEIVILELIETGSPPSIIISPKTINGRLQIPLHSYQTIECLNQDPTISADITWRRADMVCILFFIRCHIQLKYLRINWIFPKQSLFSHQTCLSNSNIAVHIPALLLINMDLLLKRSLSMVIFLKIIIFYSLLSIVYSSKNST